MRAPWRRALMDAGFRVVSGGTDTHVMLLDVFSKGVRGKEAEQALDRARITVNKNAIPFDTNPPMNPSGIRLGSPAVTTRGFREAEMREVGALIAEVLTNIANEDAIAGVRQKVEALTDRFPLYSWKREPVAGLEWRRTSSSMPGAYGISASAPTSAAWSRRWAASTATTNTPWSADRPTCARSPGCPENFHSAVYARSDHSRSGPRRVPAVSARALAGPGAHPAESRAAAHDPALRGDDPRYGEPAFRGGDVELPHAVAPLPLSPRPAARQPRDRRLARPPSAMWKARWACPPSRITPGVQRARPGVLRARRRARRARSSSAFWSAIRSNYPFLLYAGNIRRHKNIPRLVEAFAVVREQLAAHPVYKDLRLVIIGDTISQYPAVRQAVMKSRVENVVRFLGFVPFETLRCFYESAAGFRVSRRATRASDCRRWKPWPAARRWSPPT